MQRAIAYVRKSSEKEDRQTLSIDSQKSEIEKLTKRLKIKVEKVYEESFSAKKPGRKIFNQLIEDIESDGNVRVIVWNADRLSRNPVDTGRLLYLLDQGKIEEIITPTSIFKNNPNDIFMLSIFWGQAKLENDNRGVNAKRGMTKKAELGWYPAPAPLGYANTPDKKKGYKTITKDDSFTLVRKMFDEVLSGKQAIDVFRTARDVWKLTGKKEHLITRSAFYSILNNPFYFGEFEWPKGSGDWYEGKHEPMITLDEFDLIQTLLGNKGKPIQRSHTHDLTGTMRCAECGYAITATKKTKYYKGTNRKATYTYYHCSQKHKGCKTKSVNKNSLDEQINNLLSSIRPDEDFLAWAKKWLGHLHKNESKQKESILKNQQRQQLSLQTKLDRLLDLRIDGDLDQTTYVNKKQVIESELRSIDEQLAKSNNGLGEWRKNIESALDFAEAAAEKFSVGSREEKQMVLLGIGSNLMLENGKIRVDLHKHFEVFTEQENWDNKFKDWIEPQEYADVLRKNADLVPANPAWLARWNDFLNTRWDKIIEFPGYFIKTTDLLLAVVN